MSQLRPSAKLRLKVGLVEGLLDAASQEFWNHPDLEELFPGYLVKLYASVVASVPMMRVARDRASELAPDDPVAAALVPYLEHHMEEEQDHDLWLLDDMEVMGFDRAEIQSRPPDPEVAAMIGTYYYWILHAHPVAILSYFAVVEGNPVRPETLDRVAATTSVPPAALRCIRKHAELDPHHAEEVEELIDELPLTASHAALLEVSALTVIEQLTRLLQGITSSRPLAAV